MGRANATRVRVKVRGQDITLRVREMARARFTDEVRHRLRVRDRLEVRVRFGIRLKVSNRIRVYPILTVTQNKSCLHL